MKRSELLEQLEGIMKTRYKYLDTKVAALLEFIAGSDKSQRGFLMGHLLQNEGLLKPNEGECNLNQTYEDKVWYEAGEAVLPKFRAISNMVFDDVPMTATQIGKFVLSWIDQEREEINKHALLVYILYHKGPRSFVPYIELKGLAKKASEITEPEYFDEEKTFNIRKKINAIQASPILSSQFIKAAVILELVEGIEDPMEKALALTFIRKSSIPLPKFVLIPHGIGGMGGGSLAEMFGNMMGGMANGPAGDNMFEMTGFGPTNPSFIDEFFEYRIGKCALCDDNQTCQKPSGIKWRSEQTGSKKDTTH